MRGGGLAADQPADLEAVHAGQVQVEQDEVGARAHRVQPLLARARHADLQAHLLELVRLAGQAGRADAKLGLPPRRDAIANLADELALAIIFAVAPPLVPAEELELHLTLHDGWQMHLCGGIGFHAGSP